MTISRQIALNSPTGSLPAATEAVPAWLAGFGDAGHSPMSATVEANAFAALRRANAEGRHDDARDIRTLILQLGIM